MTNKTVAINNDNKISAVKRKTIWGRMYYDSVGGSTGDGQGNLKYLFTEGVMVPAGQSPGFAVESKPSEAAAPIKPELIAGGIAEKTDLT
jgi:hypothetical protein